MFDAEDYRNESVGIYSSEFGRFLVANDGGHLVMVRVSVPGLFDYREVLEDGEDWIMDQCYETLATMSSSIQEWVLNEWEEFR